MGKTESTIQAYLKRGEDLWKRAAFEKDILASNMLPSDYILWLEELLPKLKPASRRQYIASTREWLLNQRAGNRIPVQWQQDLFDAIRKSQLMQSETYSPSVKPKQRRGNTSSQKAKRFSIAELGELLIKSKDMRGKWIKPALLWMAANIHVGLRPCEWRHAYIKSKIENSKVKVELVVLNAKNTNGRSHGKERHLNITGLQKEELNFVRYQIAYIKKYAANDDSWETYYNGIRKAIYRITRQCMPKQRKYPTPYSTRHQFAANAKLAGHTKAEVAALMGHAVDTTAGAHYGKKKHGSVGFKVKPDTQEVGRIRITPPKKLRAGMKI